MKRLLSMAMLALPLAACAGPGGTPAPTTAATVAPPSSQSQTPTNTVVPTAIADGEITLVTHDSYAASDSVVADFTSQSHITVKVLKGGDAGTMVNQAILTKNNPLGDVLYGVDNTFLSRALDAGIFEPYVSPAAANVPAEFKLDPQNRVTPIDYGDVCINYDKSAFTDAKPAPKTVADLTKPDYRGELVVESPATSSPGLAFMLATIVKFGESGDYTWLDYWRDLKANDVLVVADWNAAYYTEFSVGAQDANGRPLVVSYASSPPAEVYFADPQPADSPTANVDDGCFRQIEFAGVLSGTPASAGAQAWIDFMVSPEFQSDMPLNMFVFPVNPEATVPDLFTKVPSKATNPLTMDPATIAANRDKWIQQWTDAVLH
jgi:thiamine transport system substrate-binding protein